MASKSKRQKLKKENPTLLIITSLMVGVFALLQNKFGIYSDIRTFYVIHFSDGQNLWPFSEKTLIGFDRAQNPVEYPALTGLIMWVLSFLISPSPTAHIDYYRITAGFQIVLLALCAYLIYKLVGKKWAFCFVLAPAVLYSLNRNWDIWAIAPMLFSILLFEKKKYTLSALLLSISIATKFFPIVLMLPIMLIFARNKQLIDFIKYGAITLIAWVLINLPFVLIDFQGWLYFYKFSAERALGSASFYELTNIFIGSIKFTSIHFYILNIFVFLIVTIFLLKLKKTPTLVESSFFVMFAFILFNKQYSMQYVIWLTSLAVLTLAYLSKRSQESLVYVFVLWQAFEFAFQFSFFQKALTIKNANTDTPMVIAVSNNTYATIGAIRYVIAVTFTILIARSLYKANLLRFNESQSSRA
jgi:uncharacterized membrane protein